jgi:hypothetical protein
VRRLANDYAVSDVSLVKIMNEARANQYPDFQNTTQVLAAKGAQSPNGLATKTDIPDGRQH